MLKRHVSWPTYLSWLVAGSVGLLYLASLAPGLLWQDSAMFQLRVWQVDLTGRLGLALSHPLYIVLCPAFVAFHFQPANHM